MSTKPEKFERTINDLIEGGMSLRAIATEIQEDVSLLSRILSGARPLSYRVARKLADTFGLSGEVRHSLYSEISVFTDLSPEERAALGAHLAEISTTE